MRKTVGETAYKLKFDTTNYDVKEIGHALVDDGSIAKNLEECIQKHCDIFDEEEFCAGYVIASDPLIQGVMRRKFFATLFLPSPRPEQAIFHYNKRKDELKFLWCLPAATSTRQFDETIPKSERPWTMERLYVTPYNELPQGYKRLKQWTEAFYDGVFWHFIRKQHNIEMLSEYEYLKLHREKLIKSCGDNVTSLIPDSLDIADVAIKQVNNSVNPFTSENGIQGCREAQDLNRNVAL